MASEPYHSQNPDWFNTPEKPAPWTIHDSLRRINEAFAKLQTAPPPTKAERIVSVASYQAGHVAGRCWSWLRFAAVTAKEGFDEGNEL